MDRGKFQIGGPGFLSSHSPVIPIEHRDRFRVLAGVGGLGCETDIPNAERLFAPWERLFIGRERPGGAGEWLLRGWECLAGPRERPGAGAEDLPPGAERPPGIRERPDGGRERIFFTRERLFASQIPFLG